MYELGFLVCSCTGYYPHLRLLKTCGPTRNAQTYTQTRTKHIDVAHLYQVISRDPLEPGRQASFDPPSTYPHTHHKHTLECFYRMSVTQQVQARGHP